MRREACEKRGEAWTSGCHRDITDYWSFALQTILLIFPIASCSIVLSATHSPPSSWHYYHHKHQHYQHKRHRHCMSTSTNSSSSLYRVIHKKNKIKWVAFKILKKYLKNTQTDGGEGAHCIINSIISFFYVTVAWNGFVGLACV